jgi:hypothetical protein
METLITIIHNEQQPNIITASFISQVQFYRSNSDGTQCLFVSLHIHNELHIVSLVKGKVEIGKCKYVKF